MRESVGVPERDIPLLLRDEDLWVCPAASRYPLEGEEAVAQWKEAAEFAGCLASMSYIGMINEATSQLLADVSYRADEALRRAERRLEEARAE